MPLFPKITGSKATILLIVFVALITATLWWNRTEQSDNAENISLRLAWLHGAGFEGYYAAQERGLYENEGLKVDIHPGGVDHNSILLVASGSDTFGMAGAVEVLQARNKDIPIKAIAAIYKENPIVYFSHKDSGITTPSDFRGKKIGVKTGLDTEILYRALLSQFNIKSSDVTEVPVKFDMTLFFRREVDVWPGFINVEPIIARAQGFETNLIFPKDYGIPMYAQVIFAREDFINEHPETVQKFLNATIRGWEYAVNNEQEAHALARKYDPQLNEQFEQDSFSETKLLVQPAKSKVGLMEASVWESTTEILKQQELLKQELDPRQVFTNEFLP